MLQEIITQVDGTCRDCGNEISKGSRCYLENYYDKAICFDCTVEILVKQRDRF